MYWSVVRSGIGRNNPLRCMPRFEFPCNASESHALNLIADPCICNIGKEQGRHARQLQQNSRTFQCNESNRMIRSPETSARFPQTIVTFYHCKLPNNNNRQHVLHEGGNTYYAPTCKIVLRAMSTRTISANRILHSANERVSSAHSCCQPPCRVCMLRTL